MFELLTIPDIIDKHKGKSAIIETHGPSANNNRDKINKLYEENSNEFIIFGVNEWMEFKNHPRPHYWMRSNTSRPSILKDADYYNEHTGDDITLLHCDVVEKTPDEFIKENLTCLYLPFDIRHFNGLTCEQNYKINRNFLPNGKFFKHYKNCCDKRGRLTLQEELQKYTGYHVHYSNSPLTAATHMIAFAILMGCNPIYINGMDLEYYTKNGVYAEINKDHKWTRMNPPNDIWTDWRKPYITGALKVVNESAKKIETKIINLNHNAWYGIFEKGEIK